MSIRWQVFAAVELGCAAIFCALVGWNSEIHTFLECLVAVVASFLGGVICGAELNSRITTGVQP